MKYRFIICLIMLLTTSSIFAQQEIKGFLGVEFGQKNFVSIDILKKKYPNVEWTYLCITIKNITFIGTTFNNLIITFKNGELTEGTFLLYDEKILFPNPFDNSQSIQSTIINNKNYIVQKFTNIFDNLSSTFLSKYGNPNSANNNNIIWRDANNNTITLSLIISNSETEVTVGCRGKITLTYRRGINDEF